MLTIVIKHLILYLCCIYLYYCLLNHRKIRSSLKGILFIFCVFLSVFTYWLKVYCPVISDVCPAVLLWLVMGLYSGNPRISFVTVIISFGISHALFVISSGIVLFFIILLCGDNYSSFYIYLMAGAGTIEYYSILLFFKRKRFRNGMPFLYNAAFLNVGTFIGLVSISALSLLQMDNYTQLWLAFFTPAIFIITIPILIQWWQAQLTKSYRDKLRSLELESLQKELQEQTVLLAQLKEDNEVMGRLIHKDNKVIPSMINAVYEYLTEENDNRESRIDYGNRLLHELQNMAENREKMLATLSIAKTCHSSTGIAALDALISYMGKQAKIANIKFSAVIPETTGALIDSSGMETEDLVHLLADLIENAIIAISDRTVRSIQLRIDQYGKALRIEIADTGVPFEIGSLLDFGLKPCTTHSDTGGSGIGLMDIWKIKEKYRASLCIVEYKENPSFAKKIIILLDSRDQYLISSWRAREIAPLIRRTDIHVVDSESGLGS